MNVPSQPPLYLDYAATTPVDERVAEAMRPHFDDDFGNPNSLHGFGRRAATALEEARASVARTLGARDPSEIVFTGCGTEADNTAVIGITRAATSRGRHVVVSRLEHHAVLEPAHWLDAQGFDVSYVRPSADGMISGEDLRPHLRDDTALVSIMHANNEIGSVLPIAELAAVAHEVGAFFHTDAIQSVGKVEFAAEEMGVDAASVSAHKIYGPKGVGALYLRKGTPLSPYLIGGGQENKRRSGTQNVAGAVGLAEALSIIEEERPSESPRLAGLRDRVIEGVTGGLEDVRVNGRPADGLPHLVNFLILGVEGESMLLHLDNEGIAVSTGSACSSKSLEPSHVLTAIGCPPEQAHGSLRVSLGRYTSEEDIERFLTALPPIVTRLREMSPL